MTAGAAALNVEAIEADAVMVYLIRVAIYWFWVARIGMRDANLALSASVFAFPIFSFTIEKFV